MVKRPLTETERNITIKNLQPLKDDLEYKEKVELRKKQFSLDIAEIEYKKQLKDIKKEKRRIEGDIEELRAIINVTEKQLTEGVEIKDVKEVKNE